METTVTHATQGNPCLGQSMQGKASGTQGNYCAVFPQSAYYTKSFQNIWQFTITTEGQPKRTAYCIQKGKTGPLHSDHTYRNVDMEHVLAEATPTQRSQLAWLLQHAYPALSAGEQFAQAGVNASSPPTLDHNDAYAAAQVAIWSVLDPPDPADPDGWSFFSCGTETAHPKSERLERVVAWMYRRSLEAVRELLQPLPCDESACRVATIPGLACLEICGEQAMTQGPDGWLFGPLRIHSRAPFALSIEASCAEDAPQMPLVLVDEAHTPISAPTSGQNFYISFAQNARANCYRLTLRTNPSGMCAVVLQDTKEPERMQLLGIAMESPAKGEETTVCFCTYAPAACPPCPPCPECPECPVCPECPICPEPPPCPVCPVCPVCPEPPPCPECPVCPECPEPTPCPECPACPEPPPCPDCPECPACPEPPPCPEAPSCPPCKCPALRQCSYRFPCLYPSHEKKPRRQRPQNRPGCSVANCTPGACRVVCKPKC